MIKSLLRATSGLRRDERGVTLVEYGLALVMALTLGTAGLLGMSGGVKDKMDAACDTLDPTCIP